MTTPGDCALAVGAGASCIGMILWPKSKRSVACDVAAEIAAKAKEGGAVPVGVFVDESAEEIIAACDAVGIDYAQLHGTIANQHVRSPRLVQQICRRAAPNVRTPPRPGRPASDATPPPFLLSQTGNGARAALKDLPARIKAIWVVNADASGAITTPMPGDEAELMKGRVDAMGANPVTAAIDWVKGPRRTVDWVLVDGQNAGSGETYDWKGLKAPRGAAGRGGSSRGLDPTNVSEAVMTTRPTAVDVASGVADESGVAKDKQKIEAFIQNVEAATAKL